ncbi:MAG: hypothetical protein O3A01_05170 [bacterium]|nr:hypothetical protein [bacterium]
MTDISIDVSLLIRWGLFVLVALFCYLIVEIILIFKGFRRMVERIEYMTDVKEWFRFAKWFRPSKRRNKD